jgi:hypothetical protein
MRRKKSQVLFNFLPGDTFDHSDNGVIARTSGLEGTDEGTEDLPKHYVLDRIRPQTDDWDRAPEFRASDVRFLEPDSVNFEIFPQNFRCSRCGCVTQISREDLRDDEYTPACEACGKWFRDTEQQQLVAICKCGRLESLEVPSHCPDEGLKLHRRGSSLADARWMCQCGQILGSPYDEHGRCSHCGDLDITVHSASKTFYPHRQEFVNIRSDDIDAIRSSSHYRQNVVAEYLADTVTGSPGSESLDDLTKEALERLDPETRERLEEARQATVEDEHARLKSKEEYLQEKFNDRQLRAIAEDVFEYDSILTEGVYSETLTDLAQDARDRRDLDAPTIERYVDMAADLNFAEVRLVENFPITTAVYGYTRVTPEPEDGVRLRPLRSKDRERDKDEIYVQTSDAEAIMIRLEPEAIVEWLNANDDEFNWPDSDLQDWLLEVATPPADEQVYPRFSEIDRTREARHVLVLLHTISHLMLNTMDALSGYAGDSLVEYTLPHTLSFVIYKRSQTDFNLGSMFTMVENRFDQLCDYLQDDAQNCLYDPLCEQEENSACEGCLYTSSRSCSHGNHNLARSTVYGGEFDNEDLEVGFFDV